MDHREVEGEVEAGSMTQPWAGLPTPSPIIEAAGRGFAGPSPEAVPVETLPLAPVCANCGTLLAGPFCSQCGQNVADYHRSVWRFVTDFLDNTFCWDNKLLRTLEPLFLRPGSLTLEFMAGRRVRYVHPLRLFLFTSAVCLALLHFGQPVTINTTHDRHHHGKKSAPGAAAKRKADADADNDADNTDDHDSAATPAASAGGGLTGSPAAPAPPLPPEAAAVLARLGVAANDASPAPGASPAGRDTVNAAIRDAIQDKLADKKAGETTGKAGDLGDRIGDAVEKKIAAGGMEGLTKQVTEGVRRRLSWVALGMLPIFALMLRGLYWRRDTYYFLHLVFSLHYHTFLLLFWTAYSWLGTMTDGTFLHAPVMLCLLGPPVYLFLALRRVYGDSVRRTWMKTTLLGGMHLLTIFIALAAIGALALFSAVQ